MKKSTVQQYIDVIDEAWWNKRGSPRGYPTPNPGMKATSLLGAFAAKIGKSTADLTSADMIKFFEYLRSPVGKRKVSMANKSKRKTNPHRTKAGPLQWYVGINKAGKTCFSSRNPPTRKSHFRYSQVVGPYATEQAALQNCQ